MLEKYATHTPIQDPEQIVDALAKERFPFAYDEFRRDGDRFVAGVFRYYTLDYFVRFAANTEDQDALLAAATDRGLEMIKPYEKFLSPKL